jgi:thiol-disulfide isomerase/thioredoxin
MHPNIQTTLAVHVRGLSTLALSVLAAVALLAFVAAGHAAQPFEGKSFQQAQAAGKTILIDVTASWCPTCRQQRPIVEQIENERPNLVVYDLDFDSAKDALKHFRVQYQSTLIVFRGNQEIGRSTGDTDPARIRALIAQGF